MLIVHKAVCCVTQNNALLCFQHPIAGKQIPKGTVEHAETVEQACLRELTEETGLIFAKQPNPLGTLERIVGGGYAEDGPLERHIWHVFEMPFIDLPSTWVHVAQGSSEEQGLLFDFFWQPLASKPVGFDEMYVKVIELVQKILLSVNKI
jgi:ADP-ribose pyrophosphatase YjhB (NUDIX family)